MRRRCSRATIRRRSSTRWARARMRSAMPRGATSTPSACASPPDTTSPISRSPRCRTLLVENIRAAVSGKAATSANDVAAREAALRERVPAQHRAAVRRAAGRGAASPIGSVTSGRISMTCGRPASRAARSSRPARGWSRKGRLHDGRSCRRAHAGRDRCDARAAATGRLRTRPRRTSPIAPRTPSHDAPPHLGGTPSRTAARGLAAADRGARAARDRHRHGRDVRGAAASRSRRRRSPASRPVPERSPASRASCSIPRTWPACARATC